ncbi:MULTISPECIES: tungstate ABC transporter substrate-binding protein WtpA [unclassified Lentimicrobium]|uniref:tungstate ABC transporter substrate-binding protein WtpA n=1 Tax=unclassified Lentimicrobium TaxID=2677434 RepID=UPI0015552999|nr:MULTISPECIES: tungstate ABC transporter substrate-binding protein WtpA [unclassified Lentimicrobium]NPD45143.1 tungstate ABC transporter substrate-binding protein WtpA [Lentimicrobium sp. S6]NPD86557.1 tungstate ABC transporter substrate-binding protein WtpA [Lentimicrobium sp. L6]
MKKLFAILFSVIVLFSCQSSIEDESKLIIFHAGSLSVPFKQMAEEYQKENPRVKILMESAGSRQCARKIADLKRPCDIMASADFKVIENLLIPDYTDWNIKFAGNEMAIVYHEQSRLSKEINSKNWHEILMKEEVAYGRSDPNSDPCGYRTVLLASLAEEYYQKNGLAKQLVEKDKNYIRPKETDLIGLLESNVIDYIFLYRSVAEQHGLKYLVLPDSINLQNPDLDSFYSTATAEISGKKPGEFITKKGEAMVYGITILKDAPNSQEAHQFLKFVLSKQKGMAIMEKNGQKSLVPSPSSSYENIPRELKEFALIEQ